MKLSKNIIVTIILTVAAFISLTPLSVYAEDYTGNVCDVLDPGRDAVAYRANGCGGSSTDLQGAIITVLNAIIGIMSTVAVIFIVVGGVNYITSSGDTSKVEKAKKTIIYSVIGLIVCALAFTIVNFVIINVLGQS